LPDPSTDPPQVVVGTTADRITRVSPAARTVHDAVLRAFAATGLSPDRATLRRDAIVDDADVALTELQQHDVIQLDEDGLIWAAYPFSGRPTQHLVTIDDGPTVYAMCAIDALGMSAMLGRRVTIRSIDPNNSRAVTVTVNEERAAWVPSTTVVVIGEVIDSGADSCRSPRPAADRCCGTLNFFTDKASARIWLAEHRDISGRIVDQERALQIGVETFCDLLGRRSRRIVRG
jgi:Alkylmercury lyase